VPTLHLPEDLGPNAAAEYASSVDAGWICYPTSDGVKLAPAKPNARFEAARIEDVAEMVLRRAPRGARR
jgi:hypothetical protein